MYDRVLHRYREERNWLTLTVLDICLVIRCCSGRVKTGNQIAMDFSQIWAHTGGVGTKLKTWIGYDEPSASYMFICVYVCINVHMYLKDVCVYYIHTCNNAYIYMCTYTYIYIFFFFYIHIVYIYMCVCACIPMHIYFLLHTYSLYMCVCACIPMHIYIYIHRRKCIYRCICVFVPAHFCMHQPQHMYVCVYNVIYIYMCVCSIVDLRMCSCVCVYVILCV